MIFYNINGKQATGLVVNSSGNIGALAGEYGRTLIGAPNVSIGGWSTANYVAAGLSDDVNKSGVIVDMNSAESASNAIIKY